MDASENGSVKNPSGAETIFAQLLDERGAPHPEEARSLGDGTVGFHERFANESDFNRRQVILQIHAALRPLESRELRRHRELGAAAEFFAVRVRVFRITAASEQFLEQGGRYARGLP